MFYAGNLLLESGRWRRMGEGEGRGGLSDLQGVPKIASESSSGPPIHGMWKNSFHTKFGKIPLFGISRLQTGSYFWYLTTTKKKKKKFFLHSNCMVSVRGQNVTFFTLNPSCASIR